MTETPTRQPLILIADDEPLNRGMVRVFLQRAGYAVIEASRGDEAIQRTKEQKPSLVLLDVHLGDMDGFRVAELLRSNADLNHVRIALLSAQDRPADRARARQIGADAYISKLTAWDIILEQVADLLAAIALPQPLPPLT